MKFDSIKKKSFSGFIFNIFKLKKKVHALMGDYFYLVLKAFPQFFCFTKCTFFLVFLNKMIIKTL